MYRSGSTELISDTQPKAMQLDPNSANFFFLSPRRVPESVNKPKQVKPSSGFVESKQYQRELESACSENSEEYDGPIPNRKIDQWSQEGDDYTKGVDDEQMREFRLMKSAGFFVQINSNTNSNCISNSY
jgi:hypothetical protein